MTASDKADGAAGAAMGAGASPGAAGGQAGGVERYGLKDGSSVVIRPIQPGDAGLERAFVAGLSPRSRHFRFMSCIRELPPDMLERFVNVDVAHDSAYIAVAESAGSEIEVGVSRFFSDPSGNSGEFAIAVADAWQGLGLGRLLLQKVISAALAHGLTTLTGQVLADNMRMLGLCRSLGFAIARQEDAVDVSDVSLDLQLMAQARR